MSESEKAVPLAISLPESLISELDSLAKETQETRSALIRRAIRAGLNLVKSGGTGEMVALDSELSKDVDVVSAEGKLSRQKVILDSIRIGLQPCYNRIMREQVIHSQEHSPEQAERILASMERAHQFDDPMAREMRTALRQRGAALSQLHDILDQTPEAQHRFDLVNRLIEIRHAPGGLGGGVFGMGLSTPEIDWQIRMAEKYGDRAKLPDHEIEAREAERKKEEQARNKVIAAKELKSSKTKDRATASYPRGSR